MGFVTNKRRFKNSAPSEFTVTIIVNSYINHSGGALVQRVLFGSSIIPVTLSPDATYRIDQPSGSSGITVTASGNSFIISGTPTANVTISCTTTRNPDLLTSTQKNVANWVASGSDSANYGYKHSVSSTRINWEVPYALSTYGKNEAYCIELRNTQIPSGNYIFEIRYRITDLGTEDIGCRVGISSSHTNNYVNNAFECKIEILDTQTTYTYVSVPYTRRNNTSAYLAITNQYWKESMQSQKSGRIYLDQIYLREV